MMRSIKCDHVTISYDNTDTGSQQVAIKVGTGGSAMTDWISWDQWVDLVHGFCAMAEDADKADDAEENE